MIPIQLGHGPQEMTVRLDVGNPQSLVIQAVGGGTWVAPVFTFENGASFNGVLSQSNTVATFTLAATDIQSYKTQLGPAPVGHARIIDNSQIVAAGTVFIGSGWEGDPNATNLSTVTIGPAGIPGAGGISVASYGAKMDGVTDDGPALRSAMVTAQPGQTVVIPAGTLLCGLSGGVGVTMQPGVTLAIQGTLKLASNAASWATVIDMAAGCTVTGPGTIDCNATGNPLSAPPGSGRFAIRATGAITDVTIRGVTVTNHTGKNTIWVSNVTPIQRIRVTDCTITNEGVGVTAATAYDHSSVYAEGQSIHVTGNKFSGATAYGAHAAIETHGPSQVVTGNVAENYVLLGNLTGISTSDNDNIVWADNTGRNLMAGIALYSANTEGGTSPGLRNVRVTGNVLTLNRDAYLPDAGATGAPVPVGIYLASTAANLTIEDLEVSDNQVTFDAYSAATTYDEYDASGIDFARVTANASPDLNIRIERNTIINPPGPGVRISSGDTDRMVIRDNVIIDPGGTNSSLTASTFRTGVIVAGGHHADLLIEGNVVIDDRTPHKIVSFIDLSTVAGITGGKVIEGAHRLIDGANLGNGGVNPAGGSGAAFYLECEHAVWQGIFQPVKPGSRVRDASTGDVYYNTNAIDGGAPVWVRVHPGRLALNAAEVAAVSGTLGTLTDKAALWDPSGTYVVGWLPVYNSIT